MKKLLLVTAFLATQAHADTIKESFWACDTPINLEVLKQSVIENDFKTIQSMTGINCVGLPKGMQFKIVQRDVLNLSDDPITSLSISDGKDSIKLYTFTRVIK